MKHLITLFAALTLTFTATFIAHADSQTGLTDAQLLGIISTANSSAIESGKITMDRAENDDVANYGKHMISEHFASAAKLDALELNVGFVRAESEESKKMKADSDAMAAALKSSTPAAYDKLYVDVQVNTHQDLLNKLETTYIPAAVHPEVKAYLTEVHGNVGGHLMRARELQQNL